eukprot:TRINITY_DN1752_c0_g1_i5.p1 TRINITY_DN1752_c0_g1~~TRINITY_DN1752_c0_g1_i5.p1  ORF type:complete len:4545 (-),score=1275.14 TRINITY_DN1752_c0_g1_i5:38-13672(-)
MDPDLFLAIALSQTLMDEKDSKTKEELANVQKKTLEDLVDNLIQTGSHLACEPQEILRFLKLVEKAPLSEVQLNAWVALIWMLSCRASTSPSMMEVIAFPLLQLSLKKLEESVLKGHIDETRIRLIEIIAQICGSSIDGRSALSSVTEVLKSGKDAILSTELPTPDTLSSASSQTTTTPATAGKVEMQAFLQKVLFTPPGPVTSTDATNGVPPPPPPPPGSGGAKPSTSHATQDRGETSQNYALVFVGSELRGPSRLCALCCSLLNSGIAKFDHMDQRLDFLMTVLQCLNTLPVDPLSDATVGWVIELMNIVLTISIAEQDRAKGETQFLVTKDHIKSILTLSQGRHATNVNSLSINLQLLTALQLLRHFSQKFHLTEFLQASDRLSAGIEYSNKLWSSANVELIYLSLEFVESILVNPALNTYPIKAGTVKSNVQQPSTIVSLGGGLSLDCAAQLSQKELSDVLLKGLASSLLDSVFLLLATSYIQASQPTTTKAPLRTSSARNLTESADKMVDADEGDDLFGSLFSAEPKIDVPAPVEEEVAWTRLDYTKHTISFLNELLNSSNSLVSGFLKIFLATPHMDVLLLICGLQSENEANIKAGVPVVKDAEFCRSWYSLQHDLTLNEYLPENLQMYILSKLGMKGGWPLSIPTETLIFVARIFAKRQLTMLQTTDQVEDPLIIALWDSYLANLKSVVDGTKVIEESNFLGTEESMFLLWLWQTLSDSTRSRILHLMMALSIKPPAAAQTSSSVKLALARTFLFIDYMYQYFEGMPTSFGNLVHRCLFPVERSFDDSHPVCQAPIVSLVNSKQTEEDKKRLSRAYYFLPGCLDEGTQPSSGKGSEVLLQFASYDPWYLNLVSLLKSHPSALNMTLEQAILQEYFFEVAWNILSNLPPSSTFIKQLGDKQWAQQRLDNVTLHYLRWLVRRTMELESTYATRNSGSNTNNAIPSLPSYTLPECINLCASVLASAAAVLSETVDDKGNSSDLNTRINAILHNVLLLIEGAYLHVNDAATKDKSKKRKVEEAPSDSESPAPDSMDVTSTSDATEDDALSEEFTQLATQASSLLDLIVKLESIYSRLFAHSLRQTLQGLLGEVTSDNERLGELLLKSPVPTSINLFKDGVLQKLGFEASNVEALNTLLQSLSSDAPNEPGTGASVFPHVPFYFQAPNPRLKSQSQILRSLIDTTKQIVNCIKTSKLMEITDTHIAPLFEWVSNREYEFLSSPTAELIELTLGTASPVISKTKQRQQLAHLHALLGAIATSEKYKVLLESVIVEAVTYLEQTPKPALAQFYSQEPSQMEAWLTLSQEPAFPPATTLKMLQLLSIFSQESSASSNADQTPEPTLRECLAKTIAAAGPVFMVQWIESQIQRKKSSEADTIRSETIKFLRSLKSDKACSTLLFQALLKIFSASFFQWEDGVREFFDLLKDMAIQQEALHQLVDTIVQAIEGFSVIGGALTSTNSTSMSVLLDFLHSVLVRILTPEPSAPELKASQDKMQIETPVKALKRSVDQPMKDIAQDDEEEEDSESEEAMEVEEESAIDPTSARQAECTYTQTQKSYIDQHWYYCYTCNLTFSSGMCSVCAQVCHAGHSISYSRFSRFFCDCGANPPGRGFPCRALQPQMLPAQPALPYASKMRTGKRPGRETPMQVLEALPRDASLEQALTQLFQKKDILQVLLNLYHKLLAMSNFESAEVESVAEDLFSSDKAVAQTDLYQPIRNFKPACFDCRLKMSAGDGRDLKKYAHNITRRVLAVPRNSHSQNTLTCAAIAEGEGVTMVDLSQLYEEGSILEKTAYQVLAKIPLGFEPLSLEFNPTCQYFLAVAGINQVRVITFTPSWELKDNVDVNLALSALGQDNLYVVQTAWVPGSQTHLAVVTNQFIKIYDMSKDTICPTANIVCSSEEQIKEMTFITPQHILVLSVSGVLYTHEIPAVSDGPSVLVSQIQVPPHLLGKEGASLYYLSSQQLLFCSYGDNKCWAGRLDVSKTNLMGAFPLYLPPSKATENSPAPHKAIPHNYWVEAPELPGQIVCLSRKGNQVIGLKIGKEEIAVQSIKPSSKSAAKIEGLAVQQHPSLNKKTMLVLLDDGSLFRYDTKVEVSTTSVSNARLHYSTTEIVAYLKKQKARLPKPVFPITFFEQVECVTANLNIAGEILQHYTADQAKERLNSPKQYVVSPKQEGFSITWQNPNADQVLVGVRVLVGSASVQHIPSELRLFDRTVEVTEGLRRWYDLPFSPEEALTADKEFSITIGPTFNNTNEPIVDSIEVYAMSKAKFGWKDKIDDIESELREESEQGSRNPTEYLLVSLMSTLEAYFSLCNVDKAPPSEAKAQILAEMPDILGRSGLAFLHASVKDVLRSALPDAVSYLQLTDQHLLQAAGESVKAMDTPQPWESTPLVNLLKSVGKAASQRPKNFSRVMSEFPTFPQDLTSLFWATVNFKRIPDLDNAVSSLVDILYCFSHRSLAGSLAMAPQGPVTQLMELIFSSNDLIRVSAAHRLNTLFVSSQEHSQDVGPPQALGYYKCDKCSTVIKGKRWACNVCKDFDLCDQCQTQGPPYPGSHDASHEVTAHIEDAPRPVYAESGVSHLLLPDVEADDTEALLQAAVALSLAPESTTVNSYQDILALQPASDVVMETSTLSLRNSRLGVQSIILTELLERLKKTNNGPASLPAMQVLHSLMLSLIHFRSQGVDYKVEAKQIVESLLPFIFSNTPIVEHTSQNEVHELNVLLMSLILTQRNHEGAQTDSTQESRRVPALVAEISSLLRSEGVLKYIFTTLETLLNDWQSGKGESKDSNASTGLLSPVQYFGTQSFNFAPFFSEAHVKDNSADLFAPYRQLLATSLLHLTYSLYRTERHSDKAKNENTLSKEFDAAWSSLLCTLSDGPSVPTQVQEEAQKTLLLLSGSHVQFYKLRDAALFARQMKTLESLNVKTRGFKEDMSYDDTVELIECLNAIVGVASVRAYNWQRFCLSYSTTLPFLFHSIFYFGEESALPAIKLLALAVDFESVEKDLKETLEAHDKKSKDKKKDKKKDRKSSKTAQKKKENKELNALVTELRSEVHQVAQQLVSGLNWEQRVAEFVSRFVLEFNLVDIRAGGARIIRGLWSHLTSDAFNATANECTSQLFSVVAHITPRLPDFGRNAQEFVSLLSFILSSSPASLEATTEVSRTLISTLVNTLSQQSVVLANHPNSHLYRMLSEYLEFDGYYLESEPCLVCNDPELPWFHVKMDTLRAETKFTDSTQIIKFRTSYLIQSVTLFVSDIKKANMVKTINLYYNNKAVADVSELRNKWSAWKKAKTMTLQPGQSEIKVDFRIPITATNFMMEYSTFYENSALMAVEKLQCPRCNRVVTDMKSGLCSRCRENAYQCKQCRNINYENLEAFLCNECGYSKWARFDYNFYAKPSLACEKIENDEDRNKALSTIDKEVENAHAKYLQLVQYKKPLLKLISSIHNQSEVTAETDESVQAAIAISGGGSGKVNRRIALLAALYEKECKAAFDSLSKSVQILLGTRREVQRYMHRKQSKGEAHTEATGKRRCYGCATAFVGLSLQLIESIVKMKNTQSKAQDSAMEVDNGPRKVMIEGLLQGGIVQLLMGPLLRLGSSQIRNDVKRVLCHIVRDHIDASSMLVESICRKVEYAMQHWAVMDVGSFVGNEMQLLSDSCLLEDSAWELRLALTFQLFFRSIDLGTTNPVIAEHILLPCLSILVSLTKMPVTINEISRAETTEKQHDKDFKLNLVANVEESPLVTYSDWTKDKAPYEAWKNRYQDHVIHQLPSAPAAEAKTPVSDPMVDDKEEAQNAERAAAKLAKRNKAREAYLTEKYGRRWKQHCLTRKRSATQSMEDGSLVGGLITSDWMLQLLLNSASQALRSQTKELISSLIAVSTERKFFFVDLMSASEALSRAVAAGESASEFFEILKALCTAPEMKAYLTIKGFIKRCRALIMSEITAIHAQESHPSADLSQGFALKTLLDILVSFLEVPSIKAKAKAEHLMEELLQGFLALRAVFVQKTKFIDQSSTIVSDLLNKFKEGEEGQKQFIAACIKGLELNVDITHGNAQVSQYILEQLCNIICPIKPEPVHQLILNKSPLQEEFMRGNMSNNPYSSTDVGPLMRDVKNKICTTLNLQGLLEDDNSMELLVCNKIIKLDLSIKQVFAHVWKRSLETNEPGVVVSNDNPILVVYRLQGLDGEATEEIVDSLPDTNGEILPPETEFASSAILAETNGLELLVEIIRQLTDFDVQRELALLVLRLVSNSCKIRVNRERMLALNAIPALLSTLKLAFAKESHSDIAELLLMTIESVVQQGNQSKGSFMPKNLRQSQEVVMTLAAEQDHLSQMNMFLDKLSSPLVQNNPKGIFVMKMSKILPFLTYGEKAVVDTLVDYFLPYLDFEEYDKKAGSDIAATLHLECFNNACGSIPNDPNGAQLKNVVLERKITHSLNNYIKAHFLLETDVNSPEWTDALSLPSVAYVLDILTGLARSHFPTQKLIYSEGLIPVLHKLEKTTTVKKIGNLAENLMESLREGAAPDSEVAAYEYLVTTSPSSKSCGSLNFRNCI